VLSTNGSLTLSCIKQIGLFRMFYHLSDIKQIHSPVYLYGVYCLYGIETNNLC
jgi:hypothetical protein